MPMGPLLNSFPKKINPSLVKVMYVCRLKFFFHHLSLNASLLGMVPHFVVVLIFMEKSINKDGNVSFYNEESVVYGKLIYFLTIHSFVWKRKLLSS